MSNKEEFTNQREYEAHQERYEGIEDPEFYKRMLFIKEQNEKVLESIIEVKEQRIKNLQLTINDLTK